MAGFMSGFAGALTEGIKERRARKADREDDIFKMSYQSYLSNKEDMKAMREKDKAAAANAEMLAATTDNPEESYKVIYQALKNGVDAKFLEETLRENKIKLIDTPKAPKAPSTDTAAVDSQMAGAMMDTSKTTTSQPAVQSTPVETAPVAETKSGVVRPENWFAEMFSNETADPTRYRDAAVQKISEATGEDPNEVSKVITGDYRSEITDPVKFVFQKRNKNEELQTYEKELYKLRLAEQSGNQADIAKYNLRVSVFKDKALLDSSLDSRNNVRLATLNPENGEYAGSVDVAQADIVQAREQSLTSVKTIDGRSIPLANLRPMDEKYLETRVKVFEKFGTQTEDYNNRLAAYTSVATIGNKLIRLGRENPDILTASAGASAAVQGWVNDIQGAINIFDKQFGEKAKNGVFSGTQEDRFVISKQYEETIKEASTELSDILSDETRSDADRYAAYENLQTLMVYQIAAMDLQTGRSLTVDEMGKYRELARAKDPSKLEARINETLMQKYSELQNQAVIQNNNPMIKNLELMGGGIKSGLSVMTPDDLAGMSSDIDLKQRQDIIKGLVSQQQPINYNTPKQEDTVQSQQTQASTVLDKARDAIAKGAPRDAVIQRLKERGIDPGDL